MQARGTCTPLHCLPAACEHVCVRVGGRGGLSKEHDGAVWQPACVHGTGMHNVAPNEGKRKRAQECMCVAVRLSQASSPDTLTLMEEEMDPQPCKVQRESSLLLLPRYRKGC